MNKTIKIDNKHIIAEIKAKKTEHCFKIAIAIAKACQEIELEEDKKDEL